MGRSAGLRVSACVLFTSVCARAFLLLGAAVCVSVLGRVTLLAPVGWLRSSPGCLSVRGTGVSPSMVVVPYKPEHVGRGASVPVGACLPGHSPLFPNWGEGGVSAGRPLT